MCKVTFSIWNEGTLITEYQLDIATEDIHKTHMDAASVWDEFAVVAEWDNGQHAVIEPYTYSKSLVS